MELLFCRGIFFSFLFLEMHYIFILERGRRMTFWLLCPYLLVWDTNDYLCKYMGIHSSAWFEVHTYARICSHVLDSHRSDLLPLWFTYDCLIILNRRIKYLVHHWALHRRKLDDMVLTMTLRLLYILRRSNDSSLSNWFIWLIEKQNNGCRLFASMTL